MGGGVGDIRIIMAQPDKQITLKTNMESVVETYIFSFTI